MKEPDADGLRTHGDRMLLFCGISTPSVYYSSTDGAFVTENFEQAPGYAPDLPVQAFNDDADADLQPVGIEKSI